MDEVDKKTVPADMPEDDVARIARLLGTNAREVQQIIDAWRAGMLAIVPCRVWDTVYMLLSKDFPHAASVAPATVRQLRLHVKDDNSFEVIAAVEVKEFRVHLKVELGDFGVTVFTNEAEAAEALARLTMAGPAKQVPVDSAQEELIAENKRLTELLHGLSEVAGTPRLLEAYEVFVRKMQCLYPSRPMHSRFEHADAAGYWFEYSFEGVAGVHTYRVSHTDLDKTTEEV